MWRRAGVPGVLAYADGEPVGSVAVAPRDAYPSLERSRTLKRLDRTSVWSIVCFHAAGPYRGHELMTRLLEASMWVVEGYPRDTDGAEFSPVSSYMGVASAFTAAGFVEAARGGRGRPNVRRVVEGATPGAYCP